MIYEIETGEFQEEILALEYELLQCQTVEEMMAKIPQCIPSMRCDAMYLVLDDDIDAFSEQESILTYAHQKRFAEKRFVTEGYSGHMRIRFAYRNGVIEKLEDTDIEGIFAETEKTQWGRDFLFFPIHFREYTVGYLIIKNAVYLMEKQYLFPIVNTLTTAMENLHKKEKLECMNHVLENLYIRDFMTGLYNRRGYQKMGSKYLARMHEQKQNAMIAFLDLDRLKHINDNLGHESGDWAIIALSRAITKCCQKDAVCARTGGDEFVVIQKALSDEEQKKLFDEIQEELQREKTQMEFASELTVSIGCCVSDYMSDRTLDDYTGTADAYMYEVKNAGKKRQR